MAGRITLWGAEQLLKATFGKSTEVPNTLYLALLGGTQPSPYISGSELNEPTAGDYQRFAIPNTAEMWIDTGQKQTVILASGISATVSTDWGTLRYWALCNAQTAGYIYACGSLENVLTVAAGDTLILGEMSFTLGPFYTGDF